MNLRFRIILKALRGGAILIRSPVADLWICTLVETGKGAISSPYRIRIEGCVEGQLGRRCLGRAQNCWNPAGFPTSLLRLVYFCLSTQFRPVLRSNIVFELSPAEAGNDSIQRGCNSEYLCRQSLHPLVRDNSTKLHADNQRVMIRKPCQGLCGIRTPRCSDSGISGDCTSWLLDVCMVDQRGVSMSKRKVRKFDDVDEIVARAGLGKGPWTARRR